MVSATDWLFSVALKKGITKAVQVAIAFIAGWGGAEQLGVSVDPTNGAIIVSVGALLTGLLEIIRNYLKVKAGFKFL